MTPTAPSPFAVRGIVEGFYGNPWTHEQRLELLGFMASRGLNTFVYTPKDDPLVRRAWRAPYEGRELRRLNELVNRALATGVDFVYCVSPGLSMRYSDESDLDARRASSRPWRRSASQAFGLLFDDIPRELQHAEDRAAFDTLADAHVSVANHVADRLGQRTRLMVCPTVYWGYGTEPYLVGLGEGLDPRIGLFWTGRAICSPTLDLADAATFARTTNRPATYWDNYPVNDVAMGYELHIGPYRGRDPHLWRASTGIIANGMELFESSRIPFATIADYLQDPEGYDPETSWQRALRDVAGDADVEAYALFADNVRSSCLAVDDAPIVGRAVEAFLFRVEHGEAAAAAQDLGALADRMLAAADHLLRGPVVNRALIEEARPWLVGFELGAQAIHRIAELAANGRLGATRGSALRPFLVRPRNAKVRVFGNALDRTLAELTGTHVRPGIADAGRTGTRRLTLHRLFVVEKLQAVSRLNAGRRPIGRAAARSRVDGVAGDRVLRVAGSLLDQTAGAALASGVVGVLGAVWVPLEPLEPPEPEPPPWSGQSCPLAWFGRPDGLVVPPPGLVPVLGAVPLPPVDGCVVVEGDGLADGSAAMTTAVPPTANSPTMSNADAAARRENDRRVGRGAAGGGVSRDGLNSVIEVSARSAGWWFGSAVPSIGSPPSVRAVPVVARHMPDGRPRPLRAS